MLFPRYFESQLQHRLRAIAPRAMACVVALLLTACVSSPRQSSDWSERMPADKAYYLSKYLNDANNAAIQPQDDYLKWVKRFHLGWAMFPNGWEWLTRTTLEKTPDADKKQKMTELLNELGLISGPEWAKNGKNRVINSSHLMTWGNVLKLAIKRDRQIDVTEHILRDAYALLARELQPDDIEFDRYFEENQALAAHEEDDPFDV